MRLILNTMSAEEKSSIEVDQIGWEEILKHSRHERNKSNCAPLNTEFFERVQSQFSNLKKQFQKYDNALDCPSKLSKGEKKSLILDTRAALKVALLCSSLEDAELRKDLVESLVIETECHDVICRLLCRKRGDAKCRTLASQLLSNLVTSDVDAANCIASAMSFSPSEDVMSERIRQRFANEQDLPEYQNQAGETPNWADMILASAHAGNRQAVAGIAAALHNLIVSLQSENNSNMQSVGFANELASNSILVSNLLRQILSLKSVKQSFEKHKEDEAYRAATADTETPGDSATEWISLLFVKCCTLGLLPNLLASAGGGFHQELAENLTIVPEHVVLLQCIQSEIEASDLGSLPHILGGELGVEGVVSTYVHLSKLFCSIRTSLPVESIVVAGANDVDSVIQCSALVALLEILASSLGVDDAHLALARRELGGSDCSIIQFASKELGTLVDTLSARNSGCKSRDFSISDEEQRLITALVRFIGNVCHGCRRNQDLVRLTKIPLPVQLASSEAGQSRQERNALHVLLSCTSIAHSCFTLREWAVVAIRSLLDQNELNQAEVAKLEANQPVQTATLGNLGIRVDMDADGRVSVIPEDKEL